MDIICIYNKLNNVISRTHTGNKNINVINLTTRTRSEFLFWK